MLWVVLILPGNDNTCSNLLRGNESLEMMKFLSTKKRDDMGFKMWVKVSLNNWVLSKFAVLFITSSFP